MRIGMIGKIWKMETEEKSNIQINNELKDLQHKFELLNESYLEKCKNLEDAYVKIQILLNNTGEIAKIGGW